MVINRIYKLKYGLFYYKAMLCIEFTVLFVILPEQPCHFGNKEKAISLVKIVGIRQL